MLIFKLKAQFVFLISVITLLLGRAYQLIFWDPPLRALLWDEKWMSSLIELISGKDWTTYVTDQSTDQFIRIYALFVAFIFIIGIFSSVGLLFSKKKWFTIPLYLCGIIILFHSLLSMKETFYHLGQFLEHTIQFSIPVLFAFYVIRGYSGKKLLSILKVLIAITFAAHGAYAVGFYPVPGHFVDMVINILGVNESFARMFLMIVGIIDLLLLVALFIPGLDFYALWYAAFWGLATAVARTWHGFDPDFFMSTIHQSLYLTVFRLPHGLIPLTAILVLNSLDKGVLEHEKRIT